MRSFSVHLHSTGLHPPESQLGIGMLEAGWSCDPEDGDGGLWHGWSRTQITEGTMELENGGWGEGGGFSCAGANPGCFLREGEGSEQDFADIAKWSLHLGM